MKGHKQIAKRVPKLIVVFGLPFSDKSTFAKELSEAMGAQVINSDFVRDDFSASRKLC